MKHNSRRYPITRKTLPILTLSLLILGFSTPSRAEVSSGSLSFWENTRVTGQFNTSYNYNFNNPTAAAGNGMRVFDTRHNNFDFNRAELEFENAPVDWAKFRLDLSLGADVAAVDSLKGGFIGNGVVGAGGVGGTDEFGVPQAYGEFTAPVGNGLTFKAGHFATIIGYEVIESAYNWNSSRSINFGFSIPFTHTGLLISYPLSDAWSASLGVVNGWDVVLDNNKGKTGLAQLAWTPHEDLSLSLQGAVGPEGAGADRPLTGVIDFVGTWSTTDDLTFGFNYDVGKAEGTAVAANAGLVNWQGGALYAHYKLSDLYGVTLRGEYWEDDGSRNSVAATNLDIVGTTLTTHLYMGDGWETRLEFRHDQADQAVFTRSSAATRKYQDTLSIEALYAF